MSNRQELLDALTDEQIGRMIDGEVLEVLLDNPDDTRSIDVLVMGVQTKGVYGDAELAESYPDVIGLGDKDG